ncbi:hypothetical protein [Dyadobacter sp. Leaf189]|uniref:hypothetical protein n=1 Tax=Dyadobacter sp. Leaf189 TaxID=1736295 RepID=UPI0006FA94A5|nr:hypothetical protein [Dyadobacter sp. Leaf189]KQS25547.1 hypothetical protein ASG33_22940 [Dyadobacter sp. Leaf189]
MKNFPKAGLLIVTLVIPALIFIFLKFFARNHYDLPYFNPERNKADAVIVQNGDTLFHKVSDRIFTQKQVKFSGKLTVLHYLPETCGDTCKLVVSQLQRISALHSEILELNVLTLSQGIANRNGEVPGANGKEWKLFTYPESEITSFFENELGIQKGQLENAQDLIILVDANGFVRGYYKGVDPEEIERLMAEIKILAYEGNVTK